MKAKHAENRVLSSLSMKWRLLGNVLFDSWHLFPSLQAKQIELQFTIGEAITSAAIGTRSVAARDAWLVTEEEYTPPAGAKMNDVVPWVLDVILNKHIISPNPHVRQAACIWLLSLVRKLSTHTEVKVSHAARVVGSLGETTYGILITEGW